MTDQRAQIEALCDEAIRVASTPNYAATLKITAVLRLLASTLAMPAPSEGEGELLPCPFCGGRGKLVWGTYERCNGWCVQCQGSKTCPLFCTTPYCVHDTEAEAFAAWNRRTPSPQGAVREAALVSEIAQFVRDWNGSMADGNTFYIADEIEAEFIRTPASDAGEVSGA